MDGARSGLFLPFMGRDDRRQTIRVGHEKTTIEAAAIFPIRARLRLAVPPHEGREKQKTGDTMKETKQASGTAYVHESGARAAMHEMMAAFEAF